MNADAVSQVFGLMTEVGWIFKWERITPWGSFLHVKTKHSPTISTKHLDSYLCFLFSQKLKSRSKGQTKLRQSEPLAWLLPSVGIARSTPCITPVLSPTSRVYKPSLPSHPVTRSSGSHLSRTHSFQRGWNLHNVLPASQRVWVKQLILRARLDFSPLKGKTPRQSVRFPQRSLGLSCCQRRQAPRSRRMKCWFNLGFNSNVCRLITGQVVRIGVI